MSVDLTHRHRALLLGEQMQTPVTFVQPNSDKLGKGIAWSVFLPAAGILAIAFVANDWQHKSEACLVLVALALVGILVSTYWWASRRSIIVVACFVVAALVGMVLVNDIVPRVVVALFGVS